MKYVNNFKAVKERLGDNKKKALTEIGLFVTSETKLRTPVDTGRLRNSYTFELLNENAVRIGTGVPYSVNVELGLGQRPQPHLKPAVNENLSRIMGIIEKNYKW